MKTQQFLIAAACTFLIGLVSAQAQTQTPINKSWSCVIDEQLPQNSVVYNVKKQTYVATARLIKRIKQQIAKKRRQGAGEKKLKALRSLLGGLKRCKRSGSEVNIPTPPPPSLPDQPTETPESPEYTGSVFAQADLIGPGNGIAAKCNIVVIDSAKSGEPSNVVGGSMQCRLGAVVASSSVSIAVLAELPNISQALSINTIITNGQFNILKIDFNAEIAREVRRFLLQEDSAITGYLTYYLNGVPFELKGSFNATSGEGDCVIRSSILGQGNSAQITLDLASGEVLIEFANPVEFLSTMNLFAGSTPNSPTVGQFPFPGEIVQALPTDTLLYSLNPSELSAITNAIQTTSRSLFVGIPQMGVDATLTGRFTEPQIDCQAVQ
jgi:hypothetical protein